MRCCVPVVSPSLPSPSSFCRKNAFYSQRTHSTVREHILQSENTFYSQRTHSTVPAPSWLCKGVQRISIVREHILYDREHILYDREHILYDREHILYDREHILYDREHILYDNTISKVCRGYHVYKLNMCILAS